ncbi:helix-turn-helix domain-containing protein [Streptomyces purpureus]|uniref:helix-turn-helix domain-containing protein n=1 Tax=Streptomyces purpureus TaxID=1951 RepID=UPI00379D5227
MTEPQRGRRAIEVGPTGKTVATNLGRLRERRGLTTRQLSAALERGGRPIPPSGITRMEKGERVITADDLAALATVFGVSPSALLLPMTDSPSDTVEVTGGGSVPAGDAWRWGNGDRPLKLTEGKERTEMLEHHLYGQPQWLWSAGRDASMVNAQLRAQGFPIDEWLLKAGLVEPPQEGDDG